MQSDDRLETRVIHAGEPDPPIAGAVCMPIFQTAIYHSNHEPSYHGIPYIRLNNTPNHRAVQEKLAALENAEAALVTGSGMSAITAALLSVLSAGDHLLAQNTLYGGTHTFVVNDLPRFGVAVDLVDPTRPDEWERKRRPNTKAIYVETLSNPLLGMPDLGSAVAFAENHGLVSMVDNTFASPVNFRPLEHGFHLSLHSCTKYLNGHSDLVAGAVIGGQRPVKAARHMLNHLGGCLDPHACYLLHRGMKTLALRVAAQNHNAQRLAEFLESHPTVQRVNYPGLKSHPQHAQAKALFDGFGGMLSFELAGGVDTAEKLFAHLRLPIVAPSLGGVETLITRPSTTSHSGMRPEERAAAGISDALVRVSLGIEHIDDLLADFAQALSRAV